MHCFNLKVGISKTWRRLHFNEFDPNASSTLVFTIPDGVIVSWQAGYSGWVSAYSALIDVNGSGDFYVEGSGSIINTGLYGHAINSTGNVVVNSGTVRVIDGEAINATNVTIKGGIVEATGDGGNAIFSVGNVVVNSGTVRATNGNAIFASGAGSSVTVGGGTVEATGTGVSAIITGGNVIVNSGTVRATTGYAIEVAGANSTVTVAGGVVFAWGEDIAGPGNVIYCLNNPAGFNAATSPGIVIAWDQAKGNTVYEEGSMQDITTSPTTATAYWALGPNNEGGIAYKSGNATGFLPLADVTVKVKDTPVTPVVPTTPTTPASGGKLAPTGDGSLLPITGLIIVSVLSVGIGLYAKREFDK